MEEVTAGEWLYLDEIGGWARVKTAVERPGLVDLIILTVGDGITLPGFAPGYEVLTSDLFCTMCGETTHTERQVLDDGEWSEDCTFLAYFDGDGNDLRRR